MRIPSSSLRCLRSSMYPLSQDSVRTLISQTSQLFSTVRLVGFVDCPKTEMSLNLTCKMIFICQQNNLDNRRLFWDN